MAPSMHPATPPVIAPCLTANRPLWSVMIPVYNCAAFLPETLKSVLQQAPDQNLMQIEVVDDASTDAHVEAMVLEIGKGRIAYFRQPENVGSLRNFETCLHRSNGHLIHLLHGDDKVREGYYKEMEILFRKYPDIGAAFCRYAYINETSAFLFNQPKEAVESGVLKNWLLRMAQRQRIQYCAITVKREVYEHLGGFYGVSYGEDWEMWTRLAAHYPIAYTPKILAEYRMHLHSVSGRTFVNGQNMKDLRWVMDTIEQYIPHDKRIKVRKQAEKFYAHYAIEVGNRLWHVTHNKENVKAQVREALSMHQDVFLYLKIAKLYTKLILNFS